MRWLRWIRKRRREAELDRELQAHLDLEAERRQEDGLAPEQARQAARRTLGNIALIKEDTRAVWGWPPLERVLSDLRLALRMMRRRPVFSAVAILSLAIGLGANTAAFSLVNAIVLKTLPAPGADRFVLIRQQNNTFGIENCCFPDQFFRELRRRDSDFEDILSVGTGQATLDEGGQVERLDAEIVSGNYFAMLGVRAAAGRLIQEQDEREGAGNLCVISYRLWQEQFGGRQDAIGRRVSINEEPFQVAGVAGPGFQGAALHEPHDLWIPTSAAQVVSGQGRAIYIQLLGRLKPDVSREQAVSRLNGLGREIQKIAGPATMSDRDDFLLRDGSQGIGSRKERFGRPALILFLLVGMVLLIACANLTALLLVRSSESIREAGMRIALGASKTALFRQFLSESVLLAAIGGAGGWVAARVLLQVLLAMLGPDGAGLVRQTQPDAAVFLFSVALTLACGVLFGILPAWRSARADPLPAIRGAITQRGWKSSPSSLVVAAQIALSLVLVFGAGLFAQTLRHLHSIDPGFQPEKVVQVRIDLNYTRRGGAGAGPFFGELLRNVRSLPAMRAASLATISILSGGMASTVVSIPDYTPPNGLRPVACSINVSSGYFRTLGIPLLAGRDFADTDRGQGQRVAIVNNEFARRFFGGKAVGRTFTFGRGRKAEVIGIAGDAKYQHLTEDVQPAMYLPVGQGAQALFLQVRTSGEPPAAMQQVRALVHNMDAQVPIGTVTTMELQIDQGLAPERLLAFLSTLLSSFALALAGIGLYGVLSFAVVRRTREIGIRMAIGATRSDILTMILRQSAGIAIGGITAGIPLAFAGGSLVSSLLYGLEPRDVLTAGISAAVLGITALVAALIPALRAARLEPMSALRYE